MNPIVKYFSKERAESILFVIVGVIASAIALYFFFGLKTTFMKGGQYISIGGNTGTYRRCRYFFRSPKDMARVENLAKTEQHNIYAVEIPRMKRVMRNFIIYKNVEIALIALSLLLMFTASTGTFWKGIGIGLLIQATLVLCLDYFAERRGQIYMDYLLNVDKKT